MRIVSRSDDGGRLADQAERLDAACRAVLDAVDAMVEGADGVDGASLRSRVGALLSVRHGMASAPGRDDPSLFAAAVVAATGPCDVDRVTRIMAVALAVGRVGMHGATDPHLVRKSVEKGCLVSWSSPAAPDGTGARRVVEAAPGLDLPPLRAGLADMVAHLAALPRPGFDVVCGAAVRNREYALTLLADPVSAEPRARSVSDIPY